MFLDLAFFYKNDDIEQVKPEELMALEEKHQIQLPGDYKNLMLRQNGGYLTCPDNDSSHSYSQSYFFCTVDKLGHPTAPMISSFWSLEFVTEFSFDLVKEDQMPSSLLIIGEACDTTSYLCLGVSGDSFGKVYTWTKSEHTDMWSDYDLDIPYIEKGEMRDRSVKIADSIRELLDGLCTYPKAKAWAPNEFE